MKKVPFIYKKLSEMIKADIDEHNEKKRKVDEIITRKFRINGEEMKKIREELIGFKLIKRKDQRKIKLL